MGFDDPQFEVFQQFSAKVDLVSCEIEFLMRRENCEESHEGKRIVEISQGINKLWIPLSDQVVHTHSGLVFRQVLNLAYISFGLCLLVLLDMCLLGSNSFDDGVKGHEVDVLEVVVGLGCSFEFFRRFTGIDALEDTHFSEVLEGELQFADCFSSGDILDDLSSFTGFDFPHKLDC